MEDVHDLDLNDVHDLARAIELALDLNDARACALGCALALDLNNAFAIELDLSDVLACARDRNLNLDLDLGTKRASYRAQIREIVAAVESARVLTTQARGVSAVDGGRDATRAPWRLAVRVTEWLVRVLPVTDQVMYREIYWSELFELAQAKRPRRAQLGYVLHSLAGVMALRRALRMPAPAARERRW